MLEAFEHAEYLERLIEAVVFEPAPLWPGVVGGGADESASAVELNNYPGSQVRVEFKESDWGSGAWRGLGVTAGLGCLRRRGNRTKL